MKILMLFPYAPLPPPQDLAGTKRNLPFLLELVKYHDVSVLAFGTPEEEKLFRDSYGHLVASVRFVNRKRPRIFGALQLFLLLGTGRSSFRMLYRQSMQEAIDQVAAGQKVDLIHCCVQFFGYFKFPPGIPVTSDTHEVTYDLLQRTAKNTGNPFQKAYLNLCSKLGKREELDLCRKFDLVMATTERDLQFFKKDLPDQYMAVVQNGAGAAFFEPVTAEPEPCSMVFTGLFTHLPNRDGMMFFLDKVFPLITAAEPMARIYVVGKNPPKQLLSRASDRVVVTGFVEDVRPYMARAQVYVIPLLAGGGIRGKALEAMAMKRTIVTTSVGVEGILLRDGESALFSDTPEGFANAVLRLFRDAALRKRLAENAYDTATTSYNWEAKGKELDELLRRVVEARTRKSSPALSSTR